MNNYKNKHMQTYVSHIILNIGIDPEFENQWTSTALF